MHWLDSVWEPFLEWSISARSEWILWWIGHSQVLARKWSQSQGLADSWRAQRAVWEPGSSPHWRWSRCQDLAARVSNHHWCWKDSKEDQELPDQVLKDWPFDHPDNRSRRSSSTSLDWRCSRLRDPWLHTQVNFSNDSDHSKESILLQRRSHTQSKIWLDQPSSEDQAL